MPVAFPAAWGAARSEFPRFGLADCTFVQSGGSRQVLMRNESIDEAAAVRADFRGGVVTPLACRGRGREHRVARVNARWVDRAGRHPRFYFSITAASGDVYQLQLHAGDLVWRVDSVVLEG